MTGFEPQTSGIASDRSTNWATTTALTRYGCLCPKQNNLPTLVQTKIMTKYCTVLESLSFSAKDHCKVKVRTTYTNWYFLKHSSLGNWLQMFNHSNLGPGLGLLHCWQLRRDDVCLPQRVLVQGQDVPHQPVPAPPAGLVDSGWLTCWQPTWVITRRPLVEGDEGSYWPKLILLTK